MMIILIGLLFITRATREHWMNVLTRVHSLVSGVSRRSCGLTSLQKTVREYGNELPVSNWIQVLSA